MEKTMTMGKNRTGIDASPMDSKDIIAEAARAIPNPDLSGYDAARPIRDAYYLAGATVGTVPPPGSLKGAASAGMQKLIGRQPEVLIDKLGERLAFERSGVRLYDLLIRKFTTLKSDEEGIALARLQHFRAEEAAHFALVRDAMRMLGADPTAVTPSADASAVLSQGVFMLAADPRVPVANSLDAILAAELLDNECWHNLYRLAEGFGQDDLVPKFGAALKEEREHLEQVREWISRSILDLAKVKAA